MARNEQPALQAGLAGLPQSQGPISNALSTAFDNSDARDFDPKLIAQITENVIRQLRLASVQATSAGAQSAEPTQSSPDLASHQPTVETAPPSPDITATTAAAEPNPAQPPEHDVPGLQSEPAKATTPDMKPTQGAQAEHSSPTRPRGPVRLSSSMEVTPLEKIWGAMFDEDGSPTERLDQLLRGVAVHLIEDCEPKQSIVVTPTKMVDYYRASKIEREYYPWEIIFDDEDTYISRMYRDLGCHHHLAQENVFERPDLPGLTPRGFSKWMTIMLMAHPEDEFERLKLTVVNMPISNPDDRRERFPRDISRRLFLSNPDMRSRNDLRRAIRKHAKSADIDSPEDAEVSTGETEAQAEPNQGGRSSCTQREPPGRDAPPDHIDLNGALPTRRHRHTSRVRGEGSQAHVGSSYDSASAVGPDKGAPVPNDDRHAAPASIERERKPYMVTPGGGRAHEDASSTVYPVKSSGSSSSQTLPPPPRRSSVGPAPAPAENADGAQRSTAGRRPLPGDYEHGPPPAPSAGTAGAGKSAAAHPPPAVHQYSPPSEPTRRASFTRRRAPSASQAYVGSDPRFATSESRLGNLGGASTAGPAHDNRSDASLSSSVGGGNGHMLAPGSGAALQHVVSAPGAAGLGLEASVGGTGPSLPPPPPPQDARRRDKRDSLDRWPSPTKRGRRSRAGTANGTASAGYGAAGVASREEDYYRDASRY